MSSIQERLQLKRVPLDTWNIREQLCLASAVVRSGDQNWMSVSRALKTVGEPNRPGDWYSQKSCAAQYGALLEHVETPKRKKRSSEGAVETPQESILKRLTQERIVEIQKTVAEMNQQYDQLKNEITEVRNTATSEERLREMWASLEAAKRARERETARRAAWLKEREERRARSERTWRPPAAGAGGAASAPASPLLTSLLKSSPVVTTPQHITHPANVVETVSPSAGAPTLSMLLDKTTASVPATSADSKHAAIEHIKSQLVQIERQLKASASPVPPVDIDDIEIKAEDVYAFRDIDIHIPPVGAMHKGNVRVSIEKSPYKKDEGEVLVAAPEVTEAPPVAVEQEVQEDIKEEPLSEPMELPTEEVTVTTEIVQTQEEPPADEPPPPSDVEPADEAEADSDVKVAFPEVKFPTTEIKVIHPDNLKIKEEVKDAETPPEPEKEEEVEVELNVEDAPIDVVGIESEQPSAVIAESPQQTEPVAEEVPEPIPDPPEVIEEEPVVETVEMSPDPENIPLPPDPTPEQESTTEIPLPSEPQPPTPREEVPDEPSSEPERPEELPEQIPVEDVKKEDDTEDSIPLKDIVKLEPTVPSDAEGKELEEPHTETDDDTPMEDDRLEAASNQPLPATFIRSSVHLLSREEEKDGKKRRDYSRKKKPDSRTCSGSESAPDSPSANDAERQHRLWRKSVMLVYSRLCAHKYASLFLRPISDEEAPGYSLVVKRPMDLTTIRRNIDAGVIRTTAEFQRDVLLMLSNALMYNSSEHSVYTMAKEMHEEAQSQLGMLLAAQAHAGLEPAARRKRRRHHSPPAPPHPPHPPRGH